MMMRFGDRFSSLDLRLVYLLSISSTNSGMLSKDNITCLDSQNLVQLLTPSMI